MTKNIAILKTFVISIVNLMEMDVHIILLNLRRQFFKI